jgi:hypothetical protein
MPMRHGMDAKKAHRQDEPHAQQSQYQTLLHRVLGPPQQHVTSMRWEQQGSYGARDIQT